MSDYLADIVQRNLTIEPAVRPRPLSVFEPSQATVATGLQKGQPEWRKRELSETSQAKAGASAHPTIPDHKPIEAHATQPDSSVVDIKPDVELNVSNPIDNSREEKNPAAEPPAAKDGQAILIKGPVFNRAPTPSSITMFSPDLSPAEQPATEALKLPTEKKPDTGKGQGSFSPVHHTHTGGHQPKPSFVKPLNEEPEFEETLPSYLPPRVVPPVHSRLEAIWDKQDDRISKAKPEPTIQVTIGRIEVRATQAQAKSPSKPKQQNTMGLDEYLRKRNGGGR